MMPRYSRFRIAFIAMVISAGAHGAPCPIERARSAELEAVGKNSVLSSQVLQGMPYAGDGDNPREMTKTSLSDMRNNLQETLRGDRVEWLSFAFKSDERQSDDSSVISASKDVLLCMAAPGDGVLLSDRVTHHYTTVARVDRRAGYVYIADPWPDRIFLKEGLNGAGVKAVHDDGFIRVTHDEFRRVLVGLLTMDTLQLVEQYFRMSPSAKRDPMVYLAFAQTALGTKNRRFRAAAIQLLEQGLGVALQVGQKAVEQRIASKLHYLFLLSSYEAQGEERISLNHRAQVLGARYGAKNLYEENAAEEFQDLGDTLANLRDFANAIPFFDLAIGRDPRYEVAFIHRGIAKRLLGELDQAVADLSQALHLNSVALEKLTTEYNRRQRNVWGDRKDKSRMGELANRRARGLQERGQAFLFLNRCDEATKDAKEFLAMKPDQAWMGFYMLGGCDAQAGRTESARTNFQRAMELAVDPMEKGLMKNLLDGLEP